MSEKVRYTLFALFLFLTQILGTGIVPMGLFALSLLMILSPTTFLRNLRYTPIFFLFICLSLGVGIYFALCNGLKSWNIAYWGQFYFLCILLMGVKDKKSCHQCALVRHLHVSLALRGMPYIREVSPS